MAVFCCGTLESAPKSWHLSSYSLSLVQSNNNTWYLEFDCLNIAVMCLAMDNVRKAIIAGSATNTIEKVAINISDEVCTILICILPSSNFLILYL